MWFHLTARDFEMNEGTSSGERRDSYQAAEKLCTFAHGDEADAGLAFTGAKTFAVIFDFEN